jgi:hypothetical protein
MADRLSTLLIGLTPAGSTSSSLARTVSIAAASGLTFDKSSNRASRRYSMNALFAKAAEHDDEVEDELAQRTSPRFSCHPRLPAL